MNKRLVKSVNKRENANEYKKREEACFYIKEMQINLQCLVAMQPQNS